VKPLMQFIKDKSAGLGANVDESQVRISKRITTMSINELSRAGFTLVEIIIVLAIVGLIFVIIFFAVSAAQRGQRDTARKDNVNRFVSSIQQVTANNNGTFPTIVAPTTACAPPNTACGWTAAASGTAAGWSFNMNSPLTTFSIAAPTDSLTLSWVSASGNGCHNLVSATAAKPGATGYVADRLDDGVTFYCKDY